VVRWSLRADAEQLFAGLDYVLASAVKPRPESGAKPDSRGAND